MSNLLFRRCLAVLVGLSLVTAACPLDQAQAVESMSPLPFSYGYTCLSWVHQGGLSCPNDVGNCNRYWWQGYRCKMSGSLEDFCVEDTMNQYILVIPGTCVGNTCVVQDPTSGSYMNVMVPVCYMAP